MLNGQFYSHDEASRLAKMIEEIAGQLFYNNELAPFEHLSSAELNRQIAVHSIFLCKTWKIPNAQDSVFNQIKDRIASLQKAKDAEEQEILNLIARNTKS